MNWNDEYWEQMERLYWDPRRLGCRRIIELCQDCQKKKPNSQVHGYGSVIARLQNSEVPFNDILNLFLRIAPARMSGRLFGSCFGITPFDEAFTFIGHGIQESLGLNHANITQQDVFLLGTETILMIEVKIAAKSSLLQLAKYALLAALEQQKSTVRKRPCLLYLTPTKPFPQIWSEKFKTSEDVLQAFLDYDPRRCGKPSLEKMFNRNFSGYRSTVERIEVRFMTYSALVQTLHRQRRELDATFFGDETLIRLIDGLAEAIESRKLA